MTKKIVVTLEFESELDATEVSETAREIMGDLISSYYLSGVKYSLIESEND